MSPASWVNPILAKVEYDFKAHNLFELSVHAGQKVLVAPREIQQSHNLHESEWLLLATVSRESFGMVPMNYINILSGRPELKDCHYIPPPLPIKHSQRVTNM